MLREKPMQIRTRETASQFYWHNPWAAISIAETNNWPWIHENNRIDLLQILIHDSKSEYELLYVGNPNYCSRSKAIQVMDFLYGVWGKIDVLLIQCETGSIAAAVAAALSYITGSDKNYDHFHPNHIIYNMLLKAHYDRNGWRS